MIETNTFAEITQFKLSRDFEGMAPPYWVAAYLIGGLLIDTGPEHTKHELMEAIATRKVDQVVNTHFHEDHIGADHLLVERGLPIYAHPESIPLIADGYPLMDYQRFVWGEPVWCKTTALPLVIETENFRFEPIETPGHSVGHIALYEPTRGWCFTGDIFARQDMKVIRPEESIPLTIDSFRKLIALPSERLMLFTSVGKVIEDGRTVLQATIDYLVNLAEKAQQAASQGADVAGIVESLFGGEHPFSALTQNHYSAHNLAASLLEVKL